MSGATDSGMVKVMGMVMAALCVFALVCVFAARILSVEGEDFSDPLKRNALVQRIQPMASVRTSADDLPGGDTVAAAGAAARSGEELVNGACAACHLAGVAGAPALDDEQAWAERREAGLDALVASVIDGKGAMPARGGSDYSDDEIRTAVQQMAGFEVSDSAASAEDSDAAASEESAEAAEGAADTNENAESSEAEPATESTEAETEESAESSETESATEGDDTAATEETAEGDAVAAVEESSGAEEAAALVVGKVPEGLTDNIKASVDGVCAGCHLAGVAGAPRHGDTEAWQVRADKGLAALTSSVINGLNVMPPRGGSALSDEEIPIAIQYLMSK